MNESKWAPRSMGAGGVIFLFFGVIHFWWALDWNDLEPISSLPDNFRTLFILMTAVIGLFLVFFGVLTFYFSHRLRHGDKSAEIFGLLAGCLWLARLILELVLPVKVPLSSFPDLLSIKALIFLGVAGLFIIPVWRLKWNRARSAMAETV